MPTLAPRVWPTPVTRAGAVHRLPSHGAGSRRRFGGRRPGRESLTAWRTRRKRSGSPIATTNSPRRPIDRETGTVTVCVSLAGIAQTIVCWPASSSCREVHRGTVTDCPGWPSRPRPRLRTDAPINTGCDAGLRTATETYLPLSSESASPTAASPNRSPFRIPITKRWRPVTSPIAITARRIRIDVMVASLG